MIRKPSLTKQNPRVLIVAYGETLNQAPLDDKSFDCFMLNAAHRLRPGLDRAASLWFQMHRPGSGLGHIDDADHVEWLKTWEGCPVYMLEKYDWVSQAVSFPVDDVTAEVGPGQHFYSSTIDYMVAWAIVQKYEEIHLYGCDMIGPQYQERKHSLGYYLGLARGLGIRVYLPEGCGMLRYHYVYGYEDPPAPSRLQVYLEQAERETMSERDRVKGEWEERYGKIREAEGMRRAYRNVIELLKLRENGSTL